MEIELHEEMVQARLSNFKRRRRIKKDKKSNLI